MINVKDRPEVAADSALSRRQLLRGVAGLVAVAAAPAVAVAEAAPVREPDPDVEAIVQMAFSRSGPEEAARGARLAPFCARAIESAYTFRQVYRVKGRYPTRAQTQRLLRRFSGQMRVSEGAATISYAYSFPHDPMLICVPTGTPAEEQEHTLLFFLGQLLHTGPESGMEQFHSPQGEDGTLEREAWVRWVSQWDTDRCLVAGLFRSVWLGECDPPVTS